MYYLKLVVQSVLLIAPLVFAGSLHMLAVKADAFTPLNIPINKLLFGENKTYRGLILMPILTAAGMLLVYFLNEFLPQFLQLPIDLVQAIMLGLLLGLSYILFELPNSFIKRRLGIPPGKSAEKGTMIFRLFDWLDSTIGCLIVFYFFLNVGWDGLLTLMVMGILIHAATTNILYMLNIRKERW